MQLPISLRLCSIMPTESIEDVAPAFARTAATDDAGHRHSGNYTNVATCSRRITKHSTTVT